MKKIINILLIISIFTFGMNAYAGEEASDMSYCPISVFGDTFYAIKNDGSLWGWGSNDKGILGTGTTEPIDSPIKIMDDVVCVKQNYAIKKDGSLWTWGGYYQFFQNDNKTIPVPTKVMDDVIDMDIGENHMLIIKEDKSLWGIGLNYEGQLRYGEWDQNQDMYIPGSFKTPIKIMNHVQKAKAGAEHSIVLKTDGSVWTFGSNLYGQLGCGKEIDRTAKPIKITYGMKDIYAGRSSCFAISEDNVLWRWGTNYGGRIGGEKSLDKYEPTYYTKDAKCVSSQWGFNLVVKNDGTLWAYGESEDEKELVKTSIDGAVIGEINTPIKLMDSVYFISERLFESWAQTLILTNQGEVHLFEVLPRTDEKEYEITKVFDDVRLTKVETPPENKQFIDIASCSEEEKEAIGALSKADIISGTSDSEFFHEKPVSRAEAAALFLRLTAQTKENGNGGFADVTKQQWYYHIAGASRQYGIINGFDDNTFRGDDPITHLQIFALAGRTLKNESDSAVLNDEIMNFHNIPTWAKEDIAIALQEEVISEEDLLSADDYITRAETAVILYRLYQKI